MKCDSKVSIHFSEYSLYAHCVLVLCLACLYIYVTNIFNKSLRRRSTNSHNNVFKAWRSATAWQSGLERNWKPIMTLNQDDHVTAGTPCGLQWASAKSCPSKYPGFAVFLSGHWIWNFMFLPWAHPSIQCVQKGRDSADAPCLFLFFFSPNKNYDSMQWADKQMRK